MTKSNKDTKLEELKHKYLLALADYQNLEKRVWSEHERLQTETYRKVITPFLDIKDDIDAAKKFGQHDGIDLIQHKMEDIITKLGVEQINPEGKPFEPEIMECISTEEGSEHNRVTKVHKKGYRMGTSLLRPAIVTVSITNLQKKEETP
ncbi:nucleotide exchange factor GrpE [Candidatus Roizmanbacteria bacterium CG10_big_fil_rev_8_21_14_0_10_45_7]|uniref:Protein GrpE n=1 Tax=Candidatus Roizmanbacteria bacterium CG10_big_fil_rev_8_21_14_0_10_45_7 TaxID=1974854 RepID=A0A2M8KVE9_9BACT|nr:MAG: nucleotide exchange factor GrpE [Candidatus Roizmanbacteria bacterium CG10_big_fil_rev_8_21_14_0_10_45_7]